MIQDLFGFRYGRRRELISLARFDCVLIQAHTINFEVMFEVA
jgi:hypothetical protein